MLLVKKSYEYPKVGMTFYLYRSITALDVYYRQSAPNERLGLLHSKLGDKSLIVLELLSFVLLECFFHHPAVQICAYLDDLSTLIQAHTPRVSIVELESCNYLA